jgi:Uma2 family endonuclease
MCVRPKYTSRDLETLPDVEGTRYELIDGELFVSKQPSLEHQYVCLVVSAALFEWSKSRGLGLGRPYGTPGLVFSADNDVVSDVVWISHERLRAGRDQAGHITVGPDLAVEVISPGSRNEQRDREFKLKLYSRQDVREYLIVDWQQQSIQVFRRQDAMLQLAATLWTSDTLTSPILPGFELPVASLWEPAE